ncbi:MAG: hypothetical protein HC763_26090 [Hydrococcus sp. CRU_1_1]|nr:hypothetical protein [Hydrococcus sp. CRU_1_1]
MQQLSFSERSPFLLGKERAVEIVKAVLGDAWFPCHKTTNFDEIGQRIDIDQEHPCIGAARFIEAIRGDVRANLMFRLAVASGKLDSDSLNRSIPVYQSAIAFIQGTGKLG